MNQWRKQVEKSGGAIINGHVIGGCVTQYLKAKKLGGHGPPSAQYSDLAYLGYKKDFPIFGFFGLVGKFLTWEWAVVK